MMRNLEQRIYRIELTVDQLVLFKRRDCKQGASNRDRRAFGWLHHFTCSNTKRNCRGCAVCSNIELKGGRRVKIYVCCMYPRKPELHPGLCFVKYHTETAFCQLSAYNMLFISSFMRSLSGIFSSVFELEVLPPC